MRILTSETIDKSSRTFIELPIDKVIEGLEEDNGWIEVIDMFDPDSEVRIYFDIDTCKHDKDFVKRSTLDALNMRLSTVDSDWAVCQGHREERVSYHILSRKYKLSLRDLREFCILLDLPWVDKSVYWYDWREPTDVNYFRLPNQSKKAINKEGGPLLIEEGLYEDFLICYTEKLETIKL
jgi:hypothetical protein